MKRMKSMKRMKTDGRSTITFYIYRSVDGFRWRAIRAGRIVADSGEAYTRRATAKRGAEAVIAATTHSVKVEIDDRGASR